MSGDATGALAPLRQRLFWWGDRYEDWCLDSLPRWRNWLTDDLPYVVNEVAQRVFCFVLHHVPIGDQRGKPEHDFCAYCGARLPGQAERVFPGGTS